MSEATQGQFKQFEILVAQKGTPKEQLQELFKKGFIADLLDANTRVMDRGRFRAECGLKPVVQPRGFRKSTTCGQAFDLLREVEMFYSFSVEASRLASFLFSQIEQELGCTLSEGVLQHFRNDQLSPRIEEDLYQPLERLVNKIKKEFWERSRETPTVADVVDMTNVVHLYHEDDGLLPHLANALKQLLEARLGKDCWPGSYQDSRASVKLSDEAITIFRLIAINLPK